MLWLIVAAEKRCSLRGIARISFGGKPNGRFGRKGCSTHARL